MLKSILDNMRVISVVYAVIVSLLLIFAMNKCKTYKAEKEVYENNQAALLEDVETYKTESGKNAAKSRELQLTLDEFKKNYADQVDVIKDLNLKVKRLENINTTLTKTIAGGKTVVKDSFIVIHDTIIAPNGDTTFVDNPVNVKTFAWSDPWNKIYGTLKGKEVECYYEGTDSLNIIAVRVPKKFLFFRWGTKYIEVHATNSNPSSKILYTRTITIRKKK